MSVFTCAATAVATRSGAAVLTSVANGAAAPTGTLMGILPGYSSTNCKDVTPPGGIIEQVDCGPNGDTGGPVSATFYLLSARMAWPRHFGASATA